MQRHWQKCLSTDETKLETLKKGKWNAGPKGFLSKGSWFEGCDKIHCVVVYPYLPRTRVCHLHSIIQLSLTFSWRSPSLTSLPVHDTDNLALSNKSLYLEGLVFGLFPSAVADKIVCQSLMTNAYFLSFRFPLPVSFTLSLAPVCAAESVCMSQKAAVYQCWPDWKSVNSCSRNGGPACTAITWES